MGNLIFLNFWKYYLAAKKIIESVEYKEGDGTGLKSKSQQMITKKGFWNGNIYDESFLFTKDEKQTPIKFNVILKVDNKIFDFAEELLKEDLLDKIGKTDIEIQGVIVAVDTSVSKLIICEAKLNGKTFYKFDDEVETFFPDKKNEKLSKEIGEKILATFNDCVLLIGADRYFTKEFMNKKITDINSKNFKNWLFELNIDSEKNKDFNDLIGFLNDFEFSQEALKMLNTNIASFPFNKHTDIGFTRFGSEIEIMLRNNNGRFPLKNFGTGIQQFFFILAMIFKCKSQIVIIEELELNLAPLYQKELLRFLKALIGRRYSQLLFSSHSPFFTQKGCTLIDLIHHVQIDNTVDNGTSVETYDDVEKRYDENSGESLFSLLYS